MTVLRFIALGLIFLVGCGVDPDSSNAMTDAMAPDALGNDGGDPDDAMLAMDQGRADAMVTPPDAQPASDAASDAEADMVMDAEVDAAPPPTCDDLECDESEICEDDPIAGARCIPQPCMSDRDCQPEEYCDGFCRPDVCLQGRSLCSEDRTTLLRCLDNGSGTEELRVCDVGNPAIFSTCVEVVGNEARCSCADTWDCPPNFACERGTCEGTGEPPTCLLPAADFNESLPQPEIVWGGHVVGPAEERLAEGRPYPLSAQSVSIPLVANLDDDNEDGLINELDFPEIVFMTFCGQSYNTNGTLRAIHGGGPLKGQDYFATHRERTWRHGDPMPIDNGCDGTLDPTTSVAIGDLDDAETSNGRPEIVAVDERNRIRIYDNEGYQILYHASFTGDWDSHNATPSLANIDNQGMAEIVVANDVFFLERNADGLLSIRDVFIGGDRAIGLNGQGPVSCVADILGGPEMEIIAGGTVYGVPPAPEGAATPNDCIGRDGNIVPQTPEEELFCERRLMIHWDAATLQGEEDAIDGFCAIADVMGGEPEFPPGLDNPLDGTPEVILISNGRLLILNGQTGALLREESLAVGGTGGPPNVDDFDGDGFPEIGTAGGTAYKVWDLQEPTDRCPAWNTALHDDDLPPEDSPRNPGGPDCESDLDCFFETAVCNTTIGQCVCMHNSWSRRTEDSSSRVTGSTLFDFNGDGATEVVYNDECYFRIYDGRNGQVLFKEPSESRTRIEYPIVADADNDGNAEIIFCTTNESGFCSERDDEHPEGGLVYERYNYGIEVWGDPADRWVPARRIWNQHAYHITQVREDGTIPLHEVRGWESTNGRQYNSYRAQPRASGVAPDLTVPSLGVTSVGGACASLGDHVSINAVVGNEGDVRAGPGILVGFEGRWGEGADYMALRNAEGDPILATVQSTIEPGRTARVSAEYRVADNPPGAEGLPSHVRVTADIGADPVFGGERECNEDNNSAEIEVRDPGDLPDLRVDTVEAFPQVCQCIDMTVTFTNIGTAPAENPTVQFLGGDPEQGGFELARTGYAGVIEPNQQVEVTTQTCKLAVGQTVRIYAVVDYTEQIVECDESNNIGRTDRAVQCLIPRE